MNKYKPKYIEQVLIKIINGTYSASEASYRTGYSRDNMYILLKKYKENGIESPVHKNTKRTSINKTNPDKCSLIVELYKNKYGGVNFKRLKYQLIDSNGVIVAIPPKTKILVYECLDNQLLAVYNSKLYALVISTYQKRTVVVEQKKQSAHISSPNHPWRRFILSKKR